MSRIYEAIKRAEESRSKSEWVSGSSLGVMEMPDRRRSPRWEPGMKTALDPTSSEAAEEFETSSPLTLDSAVSDRIFLLPPLPEFAAETDPFPRPDEGLMDDTAL